MIILVVLAAFGLTMSFLVHGSTFFGSNILNTFPLVGFLHIGAIIVLLPTFYVYREVFTGERRSDFWQLATINVPKLLRYFCLIFTAYAFFNFFFTIFILNEGGGPSEINGQKVLHSHGNIIRNLTDEEYDLHKAYSKRTFSGHWMVFYCLAFTALLSNLKGNKLKI